MNSILMVFYQQIKNSTQNKVGSDKITFLKSPTMKIAHHLASKEFIIVMMLFLISCRPATNDETTASNPTIRINHIQVIGSHNSYKKAIVPALMKLLMAEDSSLFYSLDYQHISLQEQLELGLRNLELDVVHDPEGGRYSNPLGVRMIQQTGEAPLPYDTLGKMETPGFKVLHIPDVDFRSNCLRFTDCLREIKNWSDAHPHHLTVAITINAKSDIIDRPGFVRPLPFTSTALDSLDAAILSVFPETQIIKPDDVRGNFETLEAAVKAHNWPVADSARGKFIFVLDETGEKQRNYIRGHVALQNRVMFVNASPGSPEAAFIILNDPVRYQDSIQQLVKIGYLVRTRADAGTLEARAGDYRRFEAALTSGAHFITTDYYLVDERFGTNYRIQLPGGVIARCNPVLSPVECQTKELE